MASSLDSYQLKWHSHANHLNGSVAALLRSERFTDVVLCTLDGCQIPAHKFILNSCSIYLSNLFESQRSSLRLGNSVVYVVLPSEITTKALHILIEYMYKGETTVSNEILDTVLKAGDLLKVRGLWRQHESQNDSADKTTTDKVTEIVKKPQAAPKKPETNDVQTPKISVKKDEKLLKTYTPVQHLNITRQSFIGPPKLVFIKTSGDSNSKLRTLAPKPVPQTIVVTPDLQHHIVEKQKLKEIHENPSNFETDVKLKKHDKKYVKKTKTDHPKDSLEVNTSDKTVLKSKDDKISTLKITKGNISLTDTQMSDMGIKLEPEWGDENDIMADDMFQTDEMIIKPELEDIIAEDIQDEEEQIYSPLTCELCFEVFHIPAEWVRHIQGHAESTTQPPTRKRKARSASDDTDETTALLRCDLCQKHFPNPGEWVRHIQSTHTETELAMCNNSAPPRRHNRYVEGDQNKTCDHCKKIFPSHASMVIHVRTHTGERPFVCGLCNKGFNVKSNLLRHLRTLHDTIVSPGNVPLLQEDIITTPSSPKDTSNDPLASTSSEKTAEHRQGS